MALNAVNLKTNPRPAHTEYSLNYHTEYVTRKTGMPLDDPDVWEAFNRAWEIDFGWSSNDGLHADWLKRGRATDMGHASYAVDGSDQHNKAESPFKTVDDVWAFDAAREYGLPDFNEQVAAYEAQVQSARDSSPEMLCTGGYYKTIVSGAIQAFGWEMLLMGCSDPKKMERVLDSFFRFTLFHMEAWAKTSVEVIIQHDDFVWTEGSFMNPAYYREVILPRYAQLWEPLHRAGKKVLFCSDGDFTEFVDDLVAAGADGMIFEPYVDFEMMVERFGSSQCLVGSGVDCRDMTFHGWDTVKASIDKTIELSRKCKGHIWAVGNHLPGNIPPDMMDHYIEYLKANWSYE